MAARVIIGGRAKRADDALADAMAMGLSGESLAALERHLGLGKPAPLWACHGRAVEALLAANTQWRMVLAASAEGLRTLFSGIDYAGARAAWDALGLEVRGADFQSFMTLEGFVKTLLNGGELA